MRRQLLALGACWLLAVALPGCPEDCSDGRDNDRDDAVDCEDSDCSLEPVCAFCGSGVVDNGEECDDGNTEDGDGCNSDCQVETVSVIQNGDFSSGFAEWSLANNPEPAGCETCDDLVTFFINGEGQAQNEPSDGPNARVLVQNITVPTYAESAFFSMRFFQDNEEPLDPQNVTTIVEDPLDFSGNGLPQNAFRIDFIGSEGDQFSAPILFELFAPTEVLGSAGGLFSVFVESPELLAFLQEHAGQELRLRISQVESTFPWEVRFDDVQLTVNDEFFGFWGILQSVPISVLTGWTLCYLDTYDISGVPLPDVLSNCEGQELLLACRETGSDTLTLAAMAPRTDVLFDTGEGNTPHNANGVGWYYSGDHSWGFAPEGAAIDRNSCDIVDSATFPSAGGQGDLRMCWHTGTNELEYGWRCGRPDFLGNTYERLIFTAQ